MGTNESSVGNLPASVQSRVDRYCEQLQVALGDQLASVVLYGGGAEGEYCPESSDVNVMVVVKKVSIDCLDRIVKPTQAGMRDFRLALLILSEDDLRRSTDVFPIKFLGMQRNHRILYGSDVLADLQISRDHLRLRCEQEIKNLMLRLRQFYLRRAGYSEQIEATLNRAVPSLVRALGVAVELSTGIVPSNKDSIVEAAEKLGLDVEPIRRSLALKRGASKPGADELRQLFGSFMQSVHDAAELMDRL